ncbi:MAG: hypothetical protein NC416_02905 [Eubacterium sp.]|nr:hypothetical protein [Eubacterium sp.]
MEKRGKNMEFDRAKFDDIYVLMNRIDMEHYPDTMKDLFLSAANLRTYAVQIYEIFAQTIYSRFPPLLRDAGSYSDPAKFDDVKEHIRKVGTPEERRDYEEALEELEQCFEREGKKFYDILQDIAGTVQEDSDILAKNCRQDLISGAYFYGKIESSMKIRGIQIEEKADVIKTVYVEPMQKLKDKIKAYDAEIDKYLDPRNAFDTFMKAMPSADEFASLVKFAEKKADASVEAMKAAYSVAMKGIEYIGGKIVNIQKMEERHKLREELDQLSKSYEQHKADYEKVVDEYDRANSLVTFMDEAKYFSDQAKPFLEHATEDLNLLGLALESKDAAAFHERVVKMEEDYLVFWD